MLELAKILCSGIAVKDYATYREYVGEFRGIESVVEAYCDEVNTKLNQR